MNKTLYLKDEEGPIWDKARELSGDRLSQVVVQALRDFVAEKEAEANGMERIVVQFDDRMQGSRPTAKAFYGHWLISPEEEYEPRSLFGLKLAIAVTAKDAVVVFHWTSATQEQKTGTLQVYPSFDDALRADWYLYADPVRSAIHEAIRRRGVPIEELNI